mmetsp:Transcript_103746/g.163826  ORF Transcript_103746/g.163826 Transcript_103746/m.163826 type:complete len:96 (+) Transcript_103746:1-288(+)
MQHAFAVAIVDNLHVALIYTPSYFFGVGLLSGDGVETVMANLKKEWVSGYLLGTGFWLPFMWFNFKVVPAAGRVQAMATANLLWNVIIDYVAHRH